MHLASREHAASRRFYETYFGFRFDALFPRADQPAATILRSPAGFRLYLEGGNSEPLPAWFHFGFFVESGEACRALHARMQADQVPIARPFVTEPFANYFCTDPDGHLVQIYYDPHGHGDGDGSVIASVRRRTARACSAATIGANFRRTPGW